MKRILCVLLVGVLMLTAFVGCEKQQSADSGKEGVQLSLDQTSLTMGVYEKAVLTATVTNNAGEAVQQGITWTSANPAVAEVADGVVFAKGAGKTTITAKLADGTEASCSVESTYLGIVPQLVLVNAIDQEGHTAYLDLSFSFYLYRRCSDNGRNFPDARFPLFVGIPRQAVSLSIYLILKIDPVKHCLGGRLFLPFQSQEKIRFCVFLQALVAIKHIVPS